MWLGVLSWEFLQGWSWSMSMPALSLPAPPIVLWSATLSIRGCVNPSPRPKGDKRRDSRNLLERNMYLRVCTLSSLQLQLRRIRSIRSLPSATVKRETAVASSGNFFSWLFRRFLSVARRRFSSSLPPAPSVVGTQKSTSWEVTLGESYKTSFRVILEFSWHFGVFMTFWSFHDIWHEDSHISFQVLESLGFWSRKHIL